VLISECRESSKEKEKKAIFLLDSRHSDILDFNALSLAHSIRTWSLSILFGTLIVLFYANKFYNQSKKQTTQTSHVFHK
jgi:hypothetical protein